MKIKIVLLSLLSLLSCSCYTAKTSYRDPKNFIDNPYYMNPRSDNNLIGYSYRDVLALSSGFKIVWSFEDSQVILTTIDYYTADKPIFRQYALGEDSLVTIVVVSSEAEDIIDMIADYNSTEYSKQGKERWFISYPSPGVLVKRKTSTEETVRGNEKKYFVIQYQKHRP